MAEKVSIFENVTKRFNTAADLVDLDVDVRKILQSTMNEITVNFPVKMDDGRIEMFTGILCNAGGVIVSYFEWLQNKRSEFWDLEQVDAKLHKIMIDAYERVHEAAKSFGVGWREAAYVVALERLEMVYTGRGIFP